MIFTKFDRYVDRHARNFTERLQNLCRMPSVAARATGMRAIAETVEQLMQRVGIGTRTFRIGSGYPIISVWPFIERTQPPIRNSRFNPASSSSIARSTSESSSLIGAMCDVNPSIVMTPLGEVIVASAWTRRHAGFGTIVPHLE